MQKGYFGSQMFSCPYFGEALTFCTNCDQSLFALMSCESILKLFRCVLANIRFFGYESFDYINFSLHFSGYWRHLYTIWVHMYRVAQKK